MEIGNRYKFKELTDNPMYTHTYSGIKMSRVAGKEFLLTGMGHINIHYQIIGSPRIHTLPKIFWNEYVEGDVYCPTKGPIQADSKLVFKFINQ